jgi:hypothetical protein
MESRPRWEYDAEMSATFVEMNLGPTAQRFMQERLADGNVLAHQILKSTPQLVGRVTTFLPSNVAPKSVEDFRNGGKLPTPPTSEWKGLHSDDETLLMIPVSNTDSWLAAKIRDYLLQAKDRVCVIEDALKRPHDAVLRKLTTRYAVHNDQVYHLMFHADAENERVLKTIKAAKSNPIFIGVLSVWQGDPLDTKRGLTLAQLQSLSASTRGFFVGAYDGEGYLLWS